MNLSFFLRLRPRRLVERIGTVLPIVLFGYFALGRRGDLAPVIWLALASLAFYAFSGWQFVPLLVASIAFNFTVGYLLIERKLLREMVHPLIDHPLPAETGPAPFRHIPPAP